MNMRILGRVATLVTIALFLTVPVRTQPDTPMSFAGIIDDFTLDPAGPWQVSGLWSLTLKGNSGRADFSVPLNMVRSDNTTRSAHTHHVVLGDGDVTLIANGFRITGNATITSNGNLAGFSGSPIDIQVTGGSTVPFSNIALTFGGAAVSHFGDQPLHGAVTERR